MINHYLSVKLDNFGKKSFVFWSKTPSKGAIVFIHGFGGNTSSTFKNFNTLIGSSTHFIGYDVYFYGYDSLYTQIANSSNHFYTFLNSISSSNLSLFQTTTGTMARDQNIVYPKLVVVAHSLGAVVARHAFITAYTNITTSQWINTIELILYAPAHKGAVNSFNAVISAIPGLFGLAGAVGRHFIVTFGQLQENSPVLTDLEERTRELIDQGIDSFTIAKNIIWASHERVVNNVNFLSDPNPAVEIQDTTHTSVCKPYSLKDTQMTELTKYL